MRVRTPRAPVSYTHLDVYKRQAWITADYILKCRGIKPKMKGGYAAGWRPDDLDEIARAMAMLDSTWLSICLLYTSRCV